MVCLFYPEHILYQRYRLGSAIVFRNSGLMSPALSRFLSAPLCLGSEPIKSLYIPLQVLLGYHIDPQSADLKPPAQYIAMYNFSIWQNFLLIHIPSPMLLFAPLLACYSLRTMPRILCRSSALRFHRNYAQVSALPPSGSTRSCLLLVKLHEFFLHRHWHSIRFLSFLQINTLVATSLPLASTGPGSSG